MSRAWEQTWYKTSFDPYSLHPGFLKRLYKFDNGRIRLRWSYDRQQWSVERKSAVTLPYVQKIPQYRKRYNPKTQQSYEVPNETYITARDGYLVIGYLPPEDPPSDWLIRNLQFSDIRRWGGSKQFADTLEAFEDARRDRKEKADSDTLRHLASETYDHLKRRYGEQVFVPSQYGQTT